MKTYIGFDSAWTDNPKAKGAICAVTMHNGAVRDFHAPRLVGFDEALAFIADLHGPDHLTVIAIDQPTIVLNRTGMRPAERAAASIICWAGGGVQPANRGRIGMFCDDAPIWTFLDNLGALQHPEQSRMAEKGLFIMEVFPALSLLSMHPDFYGRKQGPRYNPTRRKTFTLDSWQKVALTAGDAAYRFNCVEMAEWCAKIAAHPKPNKADQDRLDAVICTLIALTWQTSPRNETMTLGNLEHGYIVAAPANAAVKNYISRKFASEMDML